ncbi:hypothetical protein HME9302_02442 [Alteripontixanthobacter maritimus]|uniref:Uncharacterized protein n=1 Tax=Alteripontixanthobacter maritimus TaxID=2161824 RepID=A0A369Q8J6_9SPHN|nr:hypothetical protein [Alteripontixanthobacter maritimus]RDC61223.1 hypothetical protein HME9302_02442 [Alteripontixanthobacter maritimus]
MDSLRGHFDTNSTGLSPADAYDPSAEDEIEREVPPSPIGQDERRMQVRAYNHWAGLLADRSFPSIEDLEPENLPDFGPYSVLLDFTAGVEDPGIPYLGAELARECGTDDSIETLSDVPSRSLLSRITDHYMQILANQAPIGFEAEFVNQRGATILYRGILLPFSSDDDTIDFIYGVINWKEMADQLTSDALLLEIDQALETADAPLTSDAPLPDEPEADDDQNEEAQDVLPDPVLRSSDPVTDWADVPRDTALDDAAASDAVADDAADDTADGGEPDDESALPRPSFGSLESIASDSGADAAIEEDDYDDEYGEDGSDGTDDDAIAFIPRGMLDVVRRQTKTPALPPLDLSELEAPLDESWDQPEPDFDPQYSVDAITPPAADFAAEAEGETDTADAPLPLADCLAAARDLAQAARSCEDRSRNALYDAVGRAYDVSLAAQAEPEAYDELVSENGLTVQERAPMTPVVKLVFGTDYDKTRLTEYAAVLTHAHRIGIERGHLSHFLANAEGGLKGVVTEERRLRREANAAGEKADGPREKLARKLRAIPPQSFDDIAHDGEEFALVMIRRTPEGEIVMLGEIEDDAALVERAARKLTG